MEVRKSRFGSIGHILENINVKVKIDRDIPLNRHGTNQAKVLEVEDWLRGVVKGCSHKKNGPVEEAVS